MTEEQVKIVEGEIKSLRNVAAQVREERRQHVGEWIDERATAISTLLAEWREMKAENDTKLLDEIERLRAINAQLGYDLGEAKCMIMEPDIGDKQ